jgi:hypothetical protein
MLVWLSLTCFSLHKSWALPTQDESSTGDLIAGMIIKVSWNTELDLYVIQGFPVEYLPSYGIPRIYFHRI